MPTSPAWRRIHVPTHADTLGRDSLPLQDLAGHYLCSVGLSLLNSRHLQGKPPLSPRNPQHVEALGDALHRVAVAVFADIWGDGSSGAAHVAARQRLNRSKLLDGVPEKVAWVLAHWTSEKAERRRHGGRHGAADGVRKGKVPRWVPAQLAPFADLPAAQRKVQAMAALGCSESTYFALWKRYRERQEANAAAQGERAQRDRDLLELLPE